MNDDLTAVRVQHNHPFLSTRGISERVAIRFGVGYCKSPGRLHGRIAIPINDCEGRLVAYLARDPQRGAQEYVGLGDFNLRCPIYNLRYPQFAPYVAVTQSALDTIRLWAAGFASVAILGNTLSEQQVEMLANNFVGLKLFFAGSRDGRRLTEECLGQLRRRVAVRAVHLRAGERVENISKERIRMFMS